MRSPFWEAKRILFGGGLIYTQALRATARMNLRISPDSVARVLRSAMAQQVVQRRDLGEPFPRPEAREWFTDYVHLNRSRAHPSPSNRSRPDQPPAGRDQPEKGIRPTPFLCFAIPQIRHSDSCGAEDTRSSPRAIVAIGRASSRSIVPYTAASRSDPISLLLL